MEVVNEHKYQCNICGKCFEKQQQIGGHVITIHLISECPLCGIMCSRLSMGRHIRAHEKNNFAEKCEKCENVMIKKYGSGRFCNAKCSKSFSALVNKKEANKKISKTLSEKNRLRIWGEIETITKECVYCKSLFQVDYANRNKESCMTWCQQKFRLDPKNPKFEDNMTIAINSGKKSAALQSKIRRSKNEIEFANLCKKEFPDAEFNSSIFDGWDADVIIPSKKIAVMWNGNWHYNDIVGQKHLNKIQNRDKVKLAIIAKHGFETYVIKDHGKKNSNFVHEQFKEFMKWVNFKYCQTAGAIPATATLGSYFNGRKFGLHPKSIGSIPIESTNNYPMLAHLAEQVVKQGRECSSLTSDPGNYAASTQN